MCCSGAGQLGCLFLCASLAAAASQTAAGALLHGSLACLRVQAPKAMHLRRFSTSACALAVSALLMLTVTAALSSREQEGAAEPGSAAAEAGAVVGLRKLLQYMPTAYRPTTYRPTTYRPTAYRPTSYRCGCLRGGAGWFGTCVVEHGRQQSQASQATLVC